MSSSSVQVVREVYDAFGRRDVTAVFRLFAADIEIVQTSALPWGGSFRGHEGAREFFAKLTQHLNSTVTIDRIVDAQDHVAVIGSTRGTLNATGVPYDIAIVHVWQVRDRQVTRVHFMIDTPAMLAALAAPPDAR